MCVKERAREGSSFFGERRKEKNSGPSFVRYLKEEREEHKAGINTY